MTSLSPLSNGAFSHALRQGLDLPLTALRASMEALRLELSRDGIAGRRIHGVLREVERLSENARSLLDFATLPEPRPLRCSVEEILRSARSALDAGQRPRVLVAPVQGRTFLDVDGPLLSNCLRRLAENALEAGSEHVLLVGRLAERQATFSVIDDARRGFEAAPMLAAFRTTKPNHLGLGLTLTQRDVELMQGRLEFLPTVAGETCVRITVPAPGTG